MTTRALPQMFYTTREAAQALGCTPQHVRDLIAEGKIRCERGLTRRTILIPAAEMHRLAPDAAVPGHEAVSSAPDNRDAVRELRRWMAEGARLIAELEG